MDKTVVITEEILLKHSQEAINNLNKIHQLTPILNIFAAVYTAEICNTFFKESDKEN